MPLLVAFDFKLCHLFIFVNTKYSWTKKERKIGYALYPVISKHIPDVVEATQC